jgi:hypothetical protein
MHNRLAVEVRGDLIIVAQPGTELTAVYRRSKEQSDLVLLTASIDQQTTEEKMNQFRTEASQLALRKARELGWMV